MALIQHHPGIMEVDLLSALLGAGSLAIAATERMATVGKKAQQQTLPSAALPLVNPESARTLLQGLAVSLAVPGIQGDITEEAVGLPTSGVQAGHVAVVARGRPSLLGGGRGTWKGKAPNGASDPPASRSCYFPLI